jgi:ABC-2 type transport system permease protein
MNLFPTLNLWRAEGLRLRRQPLVWATLGAVLAVLLAAAGFAGLEARAWRASEAGHELEQARRLQAAVAQFREGPPPGPAAATATYQLGRGELGSTQMAVREGLALGVHRLDVLPVRLKATLDSRHVDTRVAGALRNPLLSDTGLPGLPAMVALLLPLAAMVLCAGLLQEERERGRLTLVRVQSRRGVLPVMVAALGWRLVALVGVAAAGTLPALMLDPGAGVAAMASWCAALLVFCAAWVLLCGLLSCLPVSAAAATLTAMALWLLLTFAVPTGLAWAAERAAPMPSRLASIVQIREAQQHSEEHEAELARAWYARHPEVPAQSPAVWPASFVARVLEQDRRLRPMALRFHECRARQAALVQRWAWWSPGLALVLWGERSAGTDAQSHLRYLQAVDDFEDRWRAFLVPHVMGRQGIGADALQQLPRFRPPEVARAAWP